MPRVVLGRELDGSTDAGALNDCLQVTDYPVPEFEADIRPLVETEQTARLIAKLSLRRFSLKRWLKWKFPPRAGSLSVVGRLTSAKSGSARSSVASSDGGSCARAETTVRRIPISERPAARSFRVFRNMPLDRASRRPPPT